MNILITGVGGPTPIGIAKSLCLSTETNFRLIGIDGSTFAPGLYNKELFDATYLVPHSSHADYWEIVSEIIEKEKVDFAFIVPELEVLEWSKKQKIADLPCKSLVPNIDLASILYDKFQTFEVLKDSGMVPVSVEVDSKRLDHALGEKLKYPFWIRGGSGAGAIGSYKVNDFGDLQNWITLNPEINDFVASEYLPGRNYACKVLFSNGELVRAASAERIGYLLSAAAPSGISGMCARGRLLNHNQLVKLSEQAMRRIFDACGLRPEGMFTVDFKEDHQGNPKITEINIRHVSFTHAFSLGGANFPLDTLDMLAGKLQKPVIHQFQDDYTFIRGVDTELFIIKDKDLKS